MTELENKKFQYKKDRMDWVMIWIVIFTVVCFGFLFYGFQYFQSPDGTTPVERNNINDLVNNKEELERQLREYEESPEFQETNQ